MNGNGSVQTGRTGGIQSLPKAAQLEKTQTIARQFGRTIQLSRSLPNLSLPLSHPKEGSPAPTQTSITPALC